MKYKLIVKVYGEIYESNNLFDLNRIAQNILEESKNFVKTQISKNCWCIVNR